VKKSRKMKRLGHVATTEDTKNAYKIWSGNLKGRDRSEDFCVNGSIIFKCAFGKQDGKFWN
jgi:hypothetical protein